MGFYEKYILPRFINCACGTKPIMKQREKVVPLATGTVLESWHRHGFESALLRCQQGGAPDRA